MFRPRHRRPSFTDLLNWTDYRWDAGPWQGGPATPPWGHRSRPRGHGLLRLILAGLAVLVGIRLVSSFQSRNGSWARKGLLAVLLIAIAAAFSRNRSGRHGW